MEEFRQLKEALQKMPSFKGGGAGKGQQQFQVPKEQPMVPANSQFQLVRQKAFPVNQENRPFGNPLASQVSGVQKQADGPLLQGQNSYGNDGPRPQANVLFTHPAPRQDANALPDALPAWPARRGDGHVVRFTRTMNSLPNGNPDLKMVMRIHVQSNEESRAPGLSPSDLKQPSAAEKPQAPDNHRSTGSKQVQMQRLVKQNSLLHAVLRLRGTRQAHPWLLFLCLLWFLLERWLKKVFVIGSTAIYCL